VEALDGCPKLRLQDLTRGDIQKYAIDSLQVWSQSCRVKPQQTKYLDPLISIITEKADGVFLWLHLILKNIKRYISRNADWDTMIQYIEHTW
jgi:hypothetical protein